jgi:AbrB family looped-hinge helix DNA binding protein
MKAVVSERGQVTIPQKLRRRLGIRPGQVLDFDEDAGRLVARKVEMADPIDAVIGILYDPSDDRTTDEIMDELRGPVDTV